MKKVLFGMLIMFSATFSFSQSRIFHENFELPSLADSVSMNSVGYAVNQWAISTTLSTQGLRSYSCNVLLNDTCYLMKLSKVEC